jgi:ABC-type nitrate/sulfonate/bicarbonate transport system permease component
VAGLRAGEGVQVFDTTPWRMALGFAIGSACGVLLGLTLPTGRG